MSLENERQCHCNPFIFSFFMAAVAAVHYVVPRRRQYIWLCMASLVFYLSDDVRYFAGLAFCILVTYVTGMLLGHEGGRGRKALLFTGVGLPALALLLFRYPLAKSVLAPLGISFYALQAIGYGIEIYRGRPSCCHRSKREKILTT